MDPGQANAAFEALTLEQREARAAAQRLKEEKARAVAAQKRIALSVFLGFGAGAALGYALFEQWQVSGLSGAGLGLLIGVWLRGRKA